MIYDYIYDVVLMEKLQYATRVSPNIHILLSRDEQDYNDNILYENLYNISKYKLPSNITVPLYHEVMHYKTMLENWKTINAKPICTNAHTMKYIHHILLLILGAKVRPTNVTSNYILNLQVIDYLAYLYRNAIYKLWITLPNNHTIRRLCSLYYPAYLDIDKTHKYSKRYYRMHIIRTVMFSDVDIM